MRFFVLLASIIVFLLPAPSHALELKREEVDRIAKEAHDALAGAKLSDGSIISQSDVDALEYPLIPYENTEQSILRGFLSGLAQLCGMKWQEENFLPYMNTVTLNNPNWSEHQLVYVSLLHGLTMGYVEQSENKPVCSDEYKNDIKKMMSE